MISTSKEVTSAPNKLSDTDTAYYTVEDVKAHNGINTASWTVVYNKVYDITPIIDKHPGGDVIRLCAGRDGTDLIESYHPAAGTAKALKWLASCYLGDLVIPADKVTSVQTSKHIGVKLPDNMYIANARPDDKFFQTLRGRVEKHLKKIGWGRHFYEAIPLFEVVVTVMLYFYAAWLVAAEHSYFWAAISGILTGRLGFMMHMGNHRGMSSNPKINRVVEALMDLIGGSSRIWSYEHAVAHHLTPNQLWTDNDCSIGEPSLRFHPGIPWKPIHRIQAPATLFAMTFGTLKWYFSDIYFLFKGQIGSQQMAITTADLVQTISFKIVWFVMHIVVPAYMVSLKFALASTMLMMAVSAHYLENIFIVNHIQEDLIPDARLHWSVQQVVGSANWASGSHFWNFISGGLNHQVEHHLFPSISHYCYPAISSIVRDTCKEFGVPYNNYSGFGSAWWAMVTYLHKLGLPPSHPEHIATPKTFATVEPAFVKTSTAATAANNGKVNNRSKTR